MKRHRDMRFGKGFETVECYTGLSGVKVPEGCIVLLECMSNLVANEFFREDGTHENTEVEILEGNPKSENTGRKSYCCNK